MTCEPLPNTGVSAPVMIILLIGIVCLLLGLGFVLRARRSPAQAGATLLLVILAVGAGVLITAAPTSPAFAAPTDCPRPEPGQTTTDAQTTGPGQSIEPSSVTESAIDPDSLTITQTSTMDNMAPGVDPVDITGLVVNNGPNDTFITAITVEIVGVVRRAGAAPGECDASDYKLVDPRMPVGEPLEPYGGFTEFAGAAIGFNNKSSNQDACQGATVQLLYRTSA